jgi:hypothetical protein
MKYCTYCKVFYNVTQRVYSTDGIGDENDNKNLEGDIKYLPLLKYYCRRCGSEYIGIRDSGREKEGLASLFG